jgi:acetate---CoA ligase (ADP-forming)
MTATALSKTAALHALFHPRSIAVVGVSASNPSGYGNRVLGHLHASEFDGEAFSVGQGLTAPGTFKSVKELPYPVDVAFLVVPAERTASVAADCAQMGVKVVFAGSAGYSETGSETGQRYLSELAAVAAQTGLHIVGPVSSGYYNVAEGMSLGYNATSGDRLRKGPVAVFGHSGAFMDPIALLIQARGGGLSLFSSTGLEIGFNVLDMAEYAITEDESTRVVALVLDSVPDGPRLRRLAETARNLGKSIVVLKLGTSTRGAEVALAHSSRLAGDAAAYDAYFASCGIAVATTLEGFATSACLLARYGGCQPGLAAVINSGAGASLLADRAADYSVGVPALAEATLARLDDVKRFPYTTTRALNPLDLGVIDTSLRARDEVPEAMSADPAVGVLVAGILTPRSDGGFLSFASSLQEGRTHDGKPLVILSPCGLEPTIREKFDGIGVAVIDGTEECMQGIAALVTVEQARTAVHQAEGKRDEAATSTLGPVGADGIDGPGMLGEAESLNWLSSFGIPVVPMRLCGDESSVQSAALELGWPVVLKGIAPSAAHKTERGLVHLNLSSLEQLSAAYQAVGGGQVLVQRQVRADCEAIVGYVVRRDVGPMLLAGLGGVFVEELRDTALCAVPATQEQVHSLVMRTALGRVLTSPRWRRPGAVESVVEVLLGLQKAGLSAGTRLSAIDVNPLVVGEEGVVAVDALVTLGEQG